MEETPSTAPAFNGNGMGPGARILARPASNGSTIIAPLSSKNSVDSGGEASLVSAVQFGFEMFLRAIYAKPLTDMLSTFWH